MAIIKTFTENQDLSKLSKSELSELISQLESGMTNLIAEGNTDKVKKLNRLIGDVIDLFLSK